MQRSVGIWVVGALAVAVWVGCSKSEPAKVEAPKLTPAPQAEAERVARSFEAAAEAQNAAEMDSYINWNTVIDRAATGLSMSEQFRKGFLNGFLGGNSGGPRISSFSRQIATAVQEGGSLKLLRVRNIKGETWALYRLLFDQGVQYQDCLLSADAKGQVMIVDIYVVAIGQLMSETLRTLIEQGISANSLTARMTGEAKQFESQIQTFSEFCTAARDNNNAKAIELFPKLAAEHRKMKLSQLLLIQCYQALEDERYDEAYKSFCKQFPNDASISLSGIDYYFVKGDVERALGCVDDVEEALGEDPYLNVLRASLLLQGKDYDKADALLVTAIKREPSLLKAYWARVQISLDQKNYQRTAELLDVLQNERKVPINDLTEAPEYAGFVASPEYKTWSAKRK